MGAQSFDDKIAQVKSQDCADQYFAPKIYTHKCAANIIEIMSVAW